jgi:hypothetical protein
MYPIMKKACLFAIQLALILVSSGCLLGGLGRPASPAPDNAPQAYSPFTAWANGNLSGIPIDAGKEALANYHEEFQIQFTGMDEKGSPVSASQQYLVELDTARKMRREVETIQSPDPYTNGTHEDVISDGQHYRVRADDNAGRLCDKESFGSENINATTFHTGVISEITPGKLLEAKTQVNGILADVYELKDIGLILRNNLKKVSGKVWIAHNTPYFLKVEAALEGEFWLDTTRLMGSATLQDEIKAQNQVPIQIPVLCANPPADLIPIPSTASEVSKNNGFITFSSPENPDPMKAYYLSELTTRGWKVEALPADSYPLALRATVTTPQAIQISIEVRINAMGNGSYVEISWRVQ